MRQGTGYAYGDEKTYQLQCEGCGQRVRVTLPGQALPRCLTAFSRSVSEGARPPHPAMHLGLDVPEPAESQPIPAL